ncbi:hypothetical protein Tco_1327098 [Tanacetum coccineum]
MVKPVWNNAQRVNHQNFAKKTHPCAKKKLVPRAVLMKSGLVSINTARQYISKTAVLVNTARQKPKHKVLDHVSKHNSEHQLKFNSIKDAKKLLEAVEKRFGRNAATRKTQRNLLKQEYENFTAPSLEMLDQTFDRLQKLVSQLELLDEKLSQEDVNQKLLRSLSPEWNTHAVV